MRKEPGLWCANLQLDSVLKLSESEKEKRLYTIRLLPLGGYVRMAGEDFDTVELQPGYRVGLIIGKYERSGKDLLEPQCC